MAWTHINDVYPIIEGGGAGTSWGVLLASENEIVFDSEKFCYDQKKS